MIALTPNPDTTQYAPHFLVRVSCDHCGAYFDMHRAGDRAAHQEAWRRGYRQREKKLLCGSCLRETKEGSCPE